MLNRPRTAEQFLKMIKSQFRLAGTRKTLEMMAKYYDAMIKAAAERAPLKPSDPKEIAAEIGIGQDSPYLQWATFHLNKLQQVPREAHGHQKKKKPLLSSSAKIWPQASMASWTKES